MFTIERATAMAILTEAEIAELLRDPKPITHAQIKKLKKLKLKNAKFSSSLKIVGESGRHFIINVRQSPKDPFDFSVILALKKALKPLILIRCNGHHDVHLNRIERTRIAADTCHIHRITERYQGFPNADPESFATETTAYKSLDEAINYLTSHFGLFDKDDSYRGGLFPYED